MYVFYHATRFLSCTDREGSRMRQLVLSVFLWAFWVTACDLCGYICIYIYGWISVCMWCTYVLCVHVFSENTVSLLLLARGINMEHDSSLTQPDGSHIIYFPQFYVYMYSKPKCFTWPKNICMRSEWKKTKQKCQSDAILVLLPNQINQCCDPTSHF